jgi:predicted nucleic acid-binding protein
MVYLFDTDAISELLRPKPAPTYVEWLMGIPREEQFTRAVVVGELYRGAFRSPAMERHLVNIRQRVIPALTVLPYDIAIAEVYGLLSAQLEEAGQVLADADLQIAATAVYHSLELVSGNLRHFDRIPQLLCNPILTRARGS